MNKEFVTYEIALELKQLGFDEPCFGSYVKLTETQNTFFMNDVVDEIDRETPLHKSLITKAPLYQQVFRWFRENYKLSGIPTHQSYDIWNLETGECFIEQYPIKSYEDAELACLIKLIEIVKGGNK
jgi:hypothetical protein